MTFSYLAVDRIPKELRPGVVYHNADFELGALLCACGCGHRVDLLVPDSHQIFSSNGLATVRPSIAVCDALCKSHYVISAGQVEWLPAFSESHAKAVMRDQIARHASVDARRRSWIDRVSLAWVAALKNVKAFFGRLLG
jgi:hypothetical protein